MHPRPTQTPDQPPTLEEIRAQDRDTCRDMLHDMMRIGVRLLEAMERQTIDATSCGEPPPPDNALAYERITRAMRRSMRLNDQFLEPFPASDPTRPAHPPRRPARIRPDQGPTIRPDSIDDPIDDPIDDRIDHHDGDDGDDGDDSIQHLTIRGQLRAIRDDLGLPPLLTPSGLVHANTPWLPEPRPRRRPFPKSPTFPATAASLATRRPIEHDPTHVRTSAREYRTRRRPDFPKSPTVQATAQRLTTKRRFDSRFWIARLAGPWP